MHNLPLILDDTKRARYKQTVSQVLYDFAFGQGRGRGAPNGVRAQASWRSILLTTGEAPATGFSEDAGTRARVISLKGPPLGAQSVENAQAAMGLKYGLMSNHGHLGCRVIDYLITNRHNWDQIKEQYHDRRNSYVESAGDDGVAARLAVYVAVLDVAASIIHSLGVPEPQVDPMSEVWGSVLDGSLDSDRPTEALRDLIGWAVANQTRFWGRHEVDKLGAPNLPNGGWAGQWKKFDDWETISILPAVAKDLLRRWDYDLNSVLDAWVRREWLQTNGRSRTWPVSIDGQRARCMVLKRQAAEIVLSADD